jgi:glycine betaine/proline transport system permease protein
MEELSAWITGYKIPVGPVGKQFFDWFTDTFEVFFDLVSVGLRAAIEQTEAALLALPEPVFILLFAALAFFLQRSWKLALFVALGMLFIWNQDLWEEMIETLVLVVYATGVSLLIGIPIGIYASRKSWMFPVLSPVLDLMQTMPTFVYLLPALILFGLGVVPGLVATVIFAVPAPIRLTYLGISEVNKALVEAGESFGCTRWQLLTKVKLPAALPTIMAGVNQCIMLSLSMVVISALVGAGGLGKPIVRALNTVNVPLGIEAGLAIVILAISLDRILKQRRRAVVSRPKG